MRDFECCRLAWNTKKSRPLSFFEPSLGRAETLSSRSVESFSTSMARVSGLFVLRSKMQKQQPGRENGGGNIEPAGVIENDVSVLQRARRTQPVGNQA